MTPPTKKVVKEFTIFVDISSNLSYPMTHRPRYHISLLEMSKVQRKLSVKCEWKLLKVSEGEWKRKVKSQYQH